MLNIYWKTNKGSITLIDSHFTIESEFEKYIYTNQDILGGDISIFSRQVRTGNRQGIPDMIGVDKDGRICLIELKNQEVTEDILPQALGYAVWAESNPDSIKAIWLESKNKPEEIVINWDNLDIRIILVAPSFKPMVCKMSQKIGYEVNLFEVRRFRHEDNEFILVEKLENDPAKRPISTKGKTDWDWAYYESEHGKESSDQFHKMVDALDSCNHNQRWELVYNINKDYVGFKYGSKLVYEVAWGGTYVWKLKVKLPENMAKEFHSTHWEFQNYSNEFKEATFRPLQPTQPSIEELEPLLRKAYDLLVGSS
ncbi:MAG: hypothetical protein ACYC6L_15855 [Anaerolineae bacterium]